jgi:hypothetical protein|tara:strand:+ start:751 stop:948 length:198 start_codon:yes stop_codon:yes gene_type:complete
MRIDQKLNEILDISDSDDIKLLAKGYLHWYNEGYLGSNSPSLMYFVHQPEKYFKEFGNVVLGVYY